MIIKGWKKYETYPPYEFSWINPIKPTQIIVQKPGGVEFWTVYTNFMNKQGKEDWEDFGRFKTKAKALAYATKYMKSHPKG
ncbi:MAG: hypothetical protein KAS32_18570 [Candidatus Peribacteraceae bacterium]|nr:hypothetical protein [Candidatus Peribacteraceae bacterium]